MNPRPGRPRHRAALAAGLVTAVAGSLLALTPTPAQAAAKKADLRVTGATVSTTSVTEGAQVTVTHTVQNKGGKKAGASTTRVYLTTDVAASLAERKASRTNPRSALLDVQLAGTAKVKALASRKKAAVKATQFTVPVGLPAGDYRVLVCADDLGKVGEADEANNCLAADKAVRVAAAPGGDDLELRTFSDSYRWPQNENDALQFLKIFCNSTYPVKPHTLSSAIASVRTYLDKNAPGGMEKLEQSGLANNATKAQELAATAVASGSPGLALAALLEAHRLQPGRGAHLVNAAALATSIGLPNEAIAFLDAAVGREFLRTPLGIPPQATAAVVRGQALVMTGRSDAAEKLFRGAKQLAPLLSEADAGLATVAACKGQDAVAKRYIARSRVRSDEKVPPTPPTDDPTPPVPNIDITRGNAVPLRQLPIAQTPSQAVKMRPVYKGISDGFQAEIQANIDEANRIEQHLRDTDEARTRAEIDRRDSIFVLVYRTHLDAEVEAAQDAFYEEIDKLTEIKEEFWGGGTGEVQSTYGRLNDEAWAACAGSNIPNCFEIEINSTCRPALVTAHGEWRSTIQDAQTRANHYFSVWSKLMTGLAANLVDEEAHQLMLNHIDGLERDVYAHLVQQAGFWTHLVNLYRDHCVDPLPAEVLNPPANEDVASPGACQGALKAMNVRAKLGPSTLKVSCERIEQSLSAEVLPLLHLFIDVKLDFRTGNVSVWAGVKGGTSGPIDAGFKSGLYVKVNQQGELVDTGARVGPSLSVGAGAAEFGAYNNEIDFSITSSLTPGY